MNTFDLVRVLSATCLRSDGRVGPQHPVLCVYGRCRMEEDEELRVVKRRQGMHRSRSTGTPGYERDLLRDDDSNEVRGPTESRAPTDDDLHDALGYGPQRGDDYSRDGLSPGQQLAADVLSQVISELIASVDWGALARKGLGEVRKRLRRSQRRTNDASTPQVLPARSAAVEPPGARGPTGGEVAEPELIMTSDEYRERALSALAAEAYAKRQRELLANARVEDEDLTPELAAAVQLMLEGNTESVDDLTMAAVAEFFKMQPDRPSPLPRYEQGEIGPGAADD